MRAPKLRHIHQPPADPDDITFPFHPTCFELFRQVSLKVLGQFDIGGLILLHKMIDYGNGERHAG